MTTETNVLCALDRTMLKNLLTASLATASTDETRPHLAGVLLEVEPKDGLIRFVSTDGHRLAKIETATLPEFDPRAGSALLPYREVKALVGVLRSKGRQAGYQEPVTIALDGDRVTFATVLDGSSTVIKASDESFPPYAKVIPDYSKGTYAGTGRIGWNARYMADVQKVAKFCANEKSGGVEVSLGGERDPVRIDMSNGEASAVVVIMSMRV